jgi:hypothetical protein
VNTPEMIKKYKKNLMDKPQKSTQIIGNVPHLYYIPVF